MTFLLLLLLAIGRVSGQVAVPDVLGARLPRLDAPADVGVGVRVASLPDGGAANPLLVDRGPPAWDAIAPQHIGPAVRQLITEESASLELLEADLAAALAAGGGSLSFDRIFKPLTQIRLRYDSVASQISHLTNVVSTPELRAAAAAVNAEQVAWELRLGQSKAVHNAMRALAANTTTWTELEPAQRRLLQRTQQEMDAAGVGLPVALRARFNEMSAELSSLQQEFSNNVLDDKAAYRLLVRDAAELDGLSAETLRTAAAAAAADGHAAATPDAGPWLLTLSPSVYSAVMTRGRNARLREALWKAERSVATIGARNNVPIMARILELRSEVAALLGFPSWAELRAQGRMASITDVSRLVDGILAAARPAAAREAAELREFAAQASGNASLQLQLWDVEHYADALRDARFNMSAETLREYLPLPAVRGALFELVKSMHGVQLQPASPKPPVWRPDVDVFDAIDVATGDKLATMYMDLYARPGEKSGGAWEHGIITGASFWRGPSPAAAAAAAVAAGSEAPQPAALAAAQAAWLRAAPREAPVVAVICNSAQPDDVARRPGLLSLREAETLFHEIGHALQDMLTTVPLGLAAGIRNIELDAVELPSMVLEKFVYDAPVLARMARHWRTGEPLPEGLARAVLGLHTFRAGSSFSAQMAKVLADMRLHGARGPAAPPPLEVYRGALTDAAPMPPWPQDAWLAQFRHLFFYGYDAGYYAYYAADVNAAAVHAAFADAAAIDAAHVHAPAGALAAVGARYRSTVLALGGSVHPKEVLQMFLGIAPSMDAWRRYNGFG